MSCKKKLVFLFSALACLGICRGEVLRSVAELEAFLNGGARERTEFDVAGTVIQQSERGFVLEDACTRVFIPNTPKPLPPVGEQIRLHGTAAVLVSGEPTIYGDQTFTVIGKGKVPKTIAVDLERIDPRELNLRRITTEGRLSAIWPMRSIRASRFS